MRLGFAGVVGGTEPPQDQHLTPSSLPCSLATSPSHVWSPHRLVLHPLAAAMQPAQLLRLLQQRFPPKQVPCAPAPGRGGTPAQPGTSWKCQSRYGMSLLFSWQIPGAAGGLQGDGHRAARPRQLEGEEEQGVQRAGEGSRAGVAPRTDTPHHPLPLLCLVWVCFTSHGSDSELLSCSPGAPGEGCFGSAPSWERLLLGMAPPGNGSPGKGSSQGLQHSGEGQPSASQSRKQRRSAYCGPWSCSAVTFLARTGAGEVAASPGVPTARGEQGHSTRVGTSQHEGFIAEHLGFVAFYFLNKGHFSSYGAFLGLPLLTTHKTGPGKAADQSGTC